MVSRKSIYVLAVVAALACAGAAQAQDRRVVREHERERYQTEHWVLDNRFHHDHYYPATGYAVAALPAGHIAVRFRGEPFWFHSGVWFHQVGPRFVVVRPPLGIIVPVLPPAYATVYFGDIPYYYANDVYYAQRPDGYEVVAPPVNAATPPPPGVPVAAAPAPQTSGSWYYCESAKGYYPYVSQCAEGWKTVPATPPPAR
jgi:hypothetical protein